MSKLEKIFGQIFGKDNDEFEEGHNNIIEVTVKGLTAEEADELHDGIVEFINDYLDKKDHVYDWHTEVTED